MQINAKNIVILFVIAIALGIFAHYYNKYQKQLKYEEALRQMEQISLENKRKNEIRNEQLDVQIKELDSKISSTTDSQEIFDLRVKKSFLEMQKQY